MITSYDDFFTELEQEFSQLKNSEIDPLLQAQLLISFLEGKLKYMNKWLKKHSFQSAKEEIHFFKVLKPSLISKIIFYNFVLKTESNLPQVRKKRIKYYENSLSKIHDFATENASFYSYYRSKAKHLDNDYFIRKPQKNISNLDVMLLNFDLKISTSHDYLMAQMVAFGDLTKYLEDKLKQIENDSNVNEINSESQSPLKWTGTQTDYVEFVYATYHGGAVDKEKVSIYELASRLGKVFSIELTDDQVYNTFQKIRGRKSDQTKFVNSMNKTLHYIITGESLD